MTAIDSSSDVQQRQLAQFFEGTRSLPQLLATLRSRRVARGYSIESGKPEYRSSTGRDIVQEEGPLAFQSAHHGRAAHRARGGDHRLVGVRPERHGPLGHRRPRRLPRAGHDRRTDGSRARELVRPRPPRDQGRRCVHLQPGHRARTHGRDPGAGRLRQDPSLVPRGDDPDPRPPAGLRLGHPLSGCTERIALRALPVQPQPRRPDLVHPDHRHRLALLQRPPQHLRRLAHLLRRRPHR